MSANELKVEAPHPHVRVLVLDRPHVLNALNADLIGALGKTFRDFYADPGAVRCVVITGAGKAFCAGGDLKERDGQQAEEWARHHRLGEQAFMAMSHCPLPIIAAVNGVAAGGGCELALLADFCYAAESARFGLPEVMRGIMPGAMGTQNLARAAGVRRAKEIALTGGLITAEEARQCGIANRVFPDEKMRDAALATAIRIAANAPLAIRKTKAAIDVGYHTDLRTGYLFELEAYGQLIGTEDRIEGVRAFAERREPVFHGR